MRSFSAPVMLVAIAALTSLRDVFTLIAIFFLCHVVMYFGFLTELLAKRSSDGSRWETPFHRRVAPHLLGYIPYVARHALYRLLHSLPRDHALAGT